MQKSGFVSIIKTDMMDRRSQNHQEVKEMNEVIKNIMERRSCRSYKPDKIKDEDLDLILEAGAWAPSGMDRQESVMVAVQDPEMIKKLSKMNAAVFGIDKDPFYGASVVVVVLADPTVPTYIEDSSLVLGNMMLAARSLGIASCWVHRAKEMFSSEEGMELKRQWGLSDSLVGIGHVVLGYPDGGFPEANPRKEGRIIKIK